MFKVFPRRKNKDATERASDTSPAVHREGRRFRGVRRFFRRKPKKTEAEIRIPNTETSFSVIDLSPTSDESQSPVMTPASNLSLERFGQQETSTENHNNEEEEEAKEDVVSKLTLTPPARHQYGDREETKEEETAPSPLLETGRLLGLPATGQQLKHGAKSLAASNVKACTVIGESTVEATKVLTKGAETGFEKVSTTCTEGFDKLSKTCTDVTTIAMNKHGEVIDTLCTTSTEGFDKLSKTCTDVTTIAMNKHGEVMDKLCTTSTEGFDKLSKTCTDVTTIAMNKQGEVRKNGFEKVSTTCTEGFDKLSKTCTDVTTITMNKQGEVIDKLCTTWRETVLAVVFIALIYSVPLIALIFKFF